MTRFRSQLEACVAKALDKQGLVYLYEPGKVHYQLECDYLPDFVLKSGPVLEVKGFFPPSDRRKVLAVKRQHPEMDLRMVFQRNQCISTGSKTTYGMWCDKHKIPWCVYPNIPEDWFQ